MCVHPQYWGKKFDASNVSVFIDGVELNDDFMITENKKELELIIDFDNKIFHIINNSLKTEEIFEFGNDIDAHLLKSNLETISIEVLGHEFVSECGGFWDENRYHTTLVESNK